MYMNIQNNYHNNINFGVKLDSRKVLEVTSKKIFYSVGTDGIRDVIKALHPTPIKATGAKGYRYYADLYGEKIMDKYPDIAKATSDVIRIADENKFIKKTELAQLIQPVINRLGKEVDIVV